METSNSSILEKRNLTKLFFEIYEDDFSDSDSDCQELDENGLPWKRKRQGRSSKVRLQKKKERELSERMQRKPDREFVCINTACTARKSTFLVEDVSRGESICYHCGAVNEERVVARTGPVGNNFVSFVAPHYESIVHYGVRDRQLRRIDPSLDPKKILILKAFFEENEASLKKEFGEPTFWGPKTFRKIFEKDSLKTFSPNTVFKRTMSRHWLQIRGRLRIEPFEVNIPEDIRQMGKERYKLVYAAFAQLNANPKSIHFKMKNIFSLNYIILMIMMNEDEDVGRNLAMYLPQTMTANQPELNNSRWKEITDFIKRHFGAERLFSGENLKDFVLFTWDAPLLTQEFILKNCCFFR